MISFIILVGLLTMLIALIIFLIERVICIHKQSLEYASLTRDMLGLASKCCDVFVKSLDRFTKVTEEFNQYLKEKSDKYNME